MAIFHKMAWVCDKLKMCLQEHPRRDPGVYRRRRPAAGVQGYTESQQPLLQEHAQAEPPPAPPPHPRGRQVQRHPVSPRLHLPRRSFNIQ